MQFCLLRHDVPYGIIQTQAGGWEMFILGDRMSEARKAKGLRQIDLAKILKVSIDSVRRWEQGKREPRVSDLENIAQHLDTSIEWLLGKSDKASATANDDLLISQDQDEVVEKVKTDPRIHAAAALLVEMDENQLRKAFDYLSDQKQLGEFQKLKGA
jgi:transcriptional regulator with XRE-family HTH domain